MLWARLLAYVTGTVNQELLLRNEYLAAENRMLRGQIKGRLLLSEEEKATLAEIAHRLPRKSRPDDENKAVAERTFISFRGPKALLDRDERPWRKWRAQRNPIRFWAGIGGSSQRSLDRDFASEWADHGLLRKSSD